MGETINWKKPILVAVTLLVFCPSWLIAQNKITALLDRNTDVYGMMLREGCDPGWFYQVLRNSGITTDPKQIEGGALKKIPPGKAIIFPLPCSDPPPALEIQRSKELLLAARRAGSKTAKVIEPAVKRK